MPNILSAVNLFDDSPPTSVLCYPGYFYADRVISALAEYYLIANPSDYFCEQDTNAGDPLDYFNFGALNYNVGAPIASGNSPVVASTGPTGAYVFATGIDPSSPRQDSGTGTWTRHGGYYILTDPAKNWPLNYWNGTQVWDAAGDEYNVITSTSDTISIYSPSPIPVNGGYQLASYSYTVYARQYGNALVLYKPTVVAAGITAASATIASAGSGYTNDDIVTVQGGTYAYGAQAEFELTVVGWNCHRGHALQWTGRKLLGLSHRAGLGNGRDRQRLDAQPHADARYRVQRYDSRLAAIADGQLVLPQRRLQRHGQRHDAVDANYFGRRGSGHPRNRTIVQAPVLANVEGSSLPYVAGQAATQVTASITATDTESATIESAMAAITGNYQPNQDVLNFTNTANITGSWNAATGVLTLSGSDTLADYQAALQSVTYADTSLNPNVATRTVSFTVNDGMAASNAVTRQIAVQSAISLGPASLPDDTVGVAYNQTITVSGGTGGVVATVSNIQGAIAGLILTGSLSGPSPPAPLPEGEGSLTISGTPTAAGTETFTVTATDTLGETTSATYSITVNPAVSLSPASLPDDTVGVAYNQTIAASGGTGPLTLVVSDVQARYPA